jgi:hypothetical protein
MPPYLVISIDIEIMPFALGSVYFIGIHVTALGSVTMHRAMKRMPHHHNCHTDSFRRVPLISWMTLPHMCALFSHMDHMWGVVEVVGDMD